MDETPSLGDTVAALRIRAGIPSQAALAERAGLSRATISMIENNHTRPEGETLQKIARALAFDVYAQTVDPTRLSEVEYTLMRSAGYVMSAQSQQAEGASGATVDDLRAAFDFDLVERFGEGIGRQLGRLERVLPTMTVEDARILVGVLKLYVETYEARARDRLATVSNRLGPVGGRRRPAETSEA